MKKGRNTTGRADSNSQRVHSRQEELRGDGTEIPGKLPAGAHLDVTI